MLEKVTHLCLIGLCGVAGFVLLQNRTQPGDRAHSLTPPNSVGRSVELPDVDWGGAGLTVVLDLSPTCHFCNDSMPFYQKLVAVRRRKGNGELVLVTSRAPVESMEKHLKEKQV